MIYIKNTHKNISLLITGIKKEEPDMFNLNSSRSNSQERFVLRPGESDSFNLNEDGDVIGIERL